MEPRSPLALSELLEQPARVAELTPADLALTLAQMAALHLSLAARLREVFPPIPACPAGDRLLTVAEVADRMSLSPHAIYRRAARLPFTVRVGRYLRFSETGLERYLDRCQGR